MEQNIIIEKLNKYIQKLIITDENDIDKIKTYVKKIKIYYKALY
jgi:hypothetical protein